MNKVENIEDIVSIRSSNWYVNCSFAESLKIYEDCGNLKFENCIFYCEKTFSNHEHVFIECQFKCDIALIYSEPYTSKYTMQDCVVENVRLYIASELTEAPDWLTCLPINHLILESGVKKLPPLIKLLKAYQNLEALIIGDVDELSDELKQQIISLPKLTSLEIYTNCDFNWIGSLTQLKTLGIHTSSVSEKYYEILTSLPECLYNLKSVHDFRLTSSMIGKLPTDCPFKELTHLTLEDNKLQAIPESWLQASLKELTISGEPIKQLPEKLSSLTQLEYLQISRLKLTKQMPSLQNLSQLKILKLDSIALDVIPVWLQYLTNLEKLSLIYNQLKSLGNAKSMQTLEQLSILNISNNELTDIDAVVSLPALTTLRASSNCLKTIPLELLTEEKSKVLNAEFDRNELSMECLTKASKCGYQIMGRVHFYDLSN